MRTRFKFPEVTEDEHQFSSDISYFITLLVALMPFFLNLFWKALEGADNAIICNDQTIWGKDLYFHGLTDLAFAGVIIAISTFTNSYFAFARLSGWKNMSRGTFFAFLFVSVSAVFNFVSYLQVVHCKIDPNSIEEIFYATLMIVLSSIFISYVAQFSVRRDEFKQARLFVQRIPRPIGETDK